MTYKKKTKEMKYIVKEKIQAYRQLTTEIKVLLQDGHPVTLAQLESNKSYLIPTRGL